MLRDEELTKGSLPRRIGTIRALVVPTKALIVPIRLGGLPLVRLLIPIHQL